MERRVIPGLALAIALAAACGGGGTREAAAPAAPADRARAGTAAIDDAKLVSADADVDDWLTHGRTYGEQRYSPLAQIDAGNVGTLGLAWALETGTKRGLEATPIVVDGILYTTGSWSVVYAVDARNGDLLWKHDPQVPRQAGRNACCDVVNRGVAVYGGRVYAGTLDGRLQALDAATGAVIWSVVTVDQSKPYTITGAPRIVKGKVIIGNGGAELGVRGYVSAYDAATGALAWRFYTVPGDPSKPFESPDLAAAANTWTGEWWKMGGGGTVWDSLAYDPDLDLLYVGTGNGSPWSRQARSPKGGDNLYVCSILALRPETGKLVWHYQTTPGDTWDFTSTQHMILADLTIDGAPRKVLMQAPKNGFFYVLDRTNGKLISAEKFAEVTWATSVDKATGRPVETATARYTGPDMIEVKPSPHGAHNWHPMSFNPKTGLVYIPVHEIPYFFKRDPKFKYVPGAWNLGIDMNVGERFPRELVSGHLLAWDPVAQKEVWRAQYTSPWNGGTLTTGGNLVFQGTAHGTFAAYRATDGKLLFETPAGTGIVAAPVTYRVGGEQYVTVMAGWGGAFALAAGDAAAAAGVVDNRGRILTFKLGGTAKLPAQEIVERQVAAIPADLDPALVKQGLASYTRWCAVCHGPGVESGGVLPDLRKSEPALLEPDALAGIVLKGAFVARGMPSFGDLVTPQEVAAIRQYVLSRRAAFLAGKP
ncbi:MAG TPA: PQQ-dependent dehydrogenase, methanol/ethanol family [Myxococcota bacterium]|nr:PQQ-dependent dehydrogenase, methanol/ethanol family [Myxococcota bacterium]